MEFTPENVEVDGLTFTYCTHEGERHWTLKDLALANIPLRTNQFTSSDVLDTRPKMVREGALADWAKNTRAKSGKRLLVWLESVRAALEGVETDGAVEGLRRCSTTETIKAREEREGSQQELGYQTIEWERFAYRGEDASGISLRAMVEAGLYAEMRVALRALRSSGLTFCTVQCGNSQGRPMEDAILALPDAQFFAATARTDMGERIARLIIEHHADFQRLLAGDEEVAEKVREHQGAAASLEQDPMIAQLEAMVRMRREALARDAKLKEHGAKLALLEEDLNRCLADRENRALAPEPEVAIKDMPKRAQINRLVRGWAYEHDGEYQEAWNQLYREYRDRYHVDLKIRAANAGAGVKGLDIAEQLGVLEEVYGVAYELFAPKRKEATK